MVYRVAEEHERITTNPASSVKQKRENNGRVCYITPAQEESLRRVMDNDHLLEFEIGLMSKRTPCTVLLSVHKKVKWTLLPMGS